MEPKENNGESEASSSVRVAVRVRPLIGSEKIESSQICITSDLDRNTIIIGKDREFAFDHVFGVESKQSEVFEVCAKDLVLSCFSGYNVTVLAYGQTGSGKTYTMGSGQVLNLLDEEVGIIPRVIKMIYEEIDKRKGKAEFTIKVSFLEIYNEDIHDLLGANSMVPEKPISIREDKGSILLMGLHEETVATDEEMSMCLHRGSIQRSTASTLMNSQSSRSHAIFTINIEQQVLEDEVTGEKISETQEYMIAKFHFVDLAGSERAKRTGAVGATLKEGISINKGLLCLGNVISALTEDSKKSTHVPYRDSKLTRILQDSLGGNAKTYMIACISPAEINFEETLNTLKYASRARHIKNKPIVNRDPQSAMIAQLRQEVFALKQEIMNYRKVITMDSSEEIKEAFAQMKTGNFEDEDRKVKLKCQQLEKRVSQLTIELDKYRSSSNDSEIENLNTIKERDIYKSKVEKYVELLKEHNLYVEEEEEFKLPSLLEEYSKTIEKLKKDLFEKDKMFKDLQVEYDNLMQAYEQDEAMLNKKTQEIEILKRSKSSSKGLDNLNEFVIKNFDDYGKIFAETVLAKIEKQENAQENAQENPQENPEDEETPETPDLEDPSTEEEPPCLAEKEELIKVESKIREKEDMLRNIEEAFKELQSKLLEEMSQQYYLKIEELEKELHTTVKERDMALEKVREGSNAEKQNVAERFRAKISQLEEKLKENQRKDREQTALYKLVENQKIQLAKLAADINKAKQDKVALSKKIKEENEAHNKWKASRQKEILQMKQLNLKKDKEIQKLQSENRKKELIAKRKSEELAAIQRRQRDIALKRRSKGSDKRDIMKWVSDYASACIEERELRVKIQNDITEKDEIEKQKLELTQQFAIAKLKLEKLEMVYEESGLINDETHLASKIQETKSELEYLSEQLETLEEKLRFKQEKIIETSQLLANSEVEDIKAKSLAINTLDDAHLLISALFDEVMTRASESKQFGKNLQKNEIQIQNLKLINDELTYEKDLLLRQHEAESTRLKMEYEAREKLILEELEERKNVHVIVPVNTEEPDKVIEELVKKDKENQEIIDNLRKDLENTLQKYNKYRKAFIEMREQVLQMKEEENKAKPKVPPPSTITSLAKAREQAKNKREKVEEETKKPKKPQSVNSSQSKIPRAISFDSEDAMTDKTQRTKLKKSETSVNQSMEQSNQPSQRWQCTQSLEAHTSAVCSMVYHENILYTGSNKAFKMWSFDTLSVISEVPCHNSFIKAMAFWPENSLIFTGCNKEINIWDAISLQKISSFVGHCEDVRALHMKDNLLISAGKSLSDGPSIFIWDLRRNNTPLYKTENMQDMYSINVHDNIAYYSGRTHNIGRLNLRSFETIKPYESNHTDIITSLAIYKDSIISGSRDKTIKRWDRADNVNYQPILNAHTDWVNSIITDNKGKYIFTAGKEGKVKVWKGGRNLKMASEIIGHASSVNCIAPLANNDIEIISGGTDKFIKVWKLIEDNSGSDSEGSNN
ncbi:unnamed protein product [Blepharisma stoltei]|uniref:Kinesin motor domain-containing protein n=1 Tax=Blepharisma stoltei TaxID=1481888 RepID=A0AAU9I907_9CILI|nr:unnamed protein product [Blepharisma stoltei]